MIMNTEGRVKLLKTWVQWLERIGYKESAKYWQKAAEDLRKEVMTVEPKDRPKGLYHKFFVLNLWSDSWAREAARRYAELCREENPELADDLEEVIAEAEAAQLTKAAIRGIM